MIPRAPIESVSLRSLSFWHEIDKPVFHDVTIDLPPGEIVRIGGLAGAGKSTLLKILAGLLHPTDGSVAISGRAVSEMSFEEFLPYRLNIGYSFDMGGLIHNKTIMDNLALPLTYHKLLDPRDIEERVNDLMTRYGLQTSALLRPSAISGSKRKATVVARSLVLEPEMLLMDDPTTGLNPEMRQGLVRHIHELRARGRAKHVFVVSDDSDFLKALGSREIHISELTISARSMELKQGKAG